jgi:hypothetical protein
LEPRMLTNSVSADFVVVLSIRYLLDDTAPKKFRHG